MQYQNLPIYAGIQEPYFPRYGKREEFGNLTLLGDKLFQG
jgi:hypothetical protein